MTATQLKRVSHSSSPAYPAGPAFAADPSSPKPYSKAPRIGVMSFASHLCHGCSTHDAGINPTWYSDEATAKFRRNHAQYAACHGYTLLTPDGIHGTDAYASESLQRCYAEMLPVARMVAVPAWAKVPLIRSCVRHFDWLLWLDADVIVSNLSRSVPELISSLVPSGRWCNLLMAEDVDGMKSLFNTGVMLVNGSSWSWRLYEWLMADGWRMQQDKSAHHRVSVDEWRGMNQSAWRIGPQGCGPDEPSDDKWVVAALQTAGLPSPPPPPPKTAAHSKRSWFGRRLWEQMYIHKYFWEHPADRCRYCIARPAQKLQGFAKRGQWDSEFAIHITYSRNNHTKARISKLIDSAKCEKPQLLS